MKTTPRSKLYVVRVWNEPGDEWRAMLEDAGTHDRRGFTSPTALADFIAAAAPEDAADQTIRQNPAPPAIDASKS